MSTSEIVNYGGSCGKVLVDSDWASQFYQNFNFYHNQLPGLSVTITTEFSFLGLNEITGYWFMSAKCKCHGYCKMELGSFPHFSSPSLVTLCKKKINTRCLNTTNSNIPRTFQPFIRDFVKFQSGTSTWAIKRLEVLLIFASGRI